MKQLIFFLFLLTFGACTSIIQWNTQEQTILLKKRMPGAPCLTSKAPMALSPSRQLSYDFLEFLSHLEKKNQLKSIDRFILWTLLQMKARPDMVTPNSHFYIMASLRQQKHLYLSFTQQKYPLIRGLKYLLKRYHSRHSLFFLAKLLDRKYKPRIIVTRGLEKSITSFLPQIIENQVAKKFYLKSDQPLIKGETLPYLSLKKYLPKKFQRGPLKVQQHLFSYSLNSETKILCNKDLNLFDHSLFLISKSPPKELSFSYIDQNQDSFQAVISASPKGIHKKIRTPFMAVETPYRPPTFCSITNSKTKLSLSILSTQSRDSAQHLHHLIKIGLPLAKTQEDLYNLLDLPRHLFLMRPMRIIVETNKVTQRTMNSLHSLHFPIYHKENLGHLEAITRFSSGQALILDGGRTGGHISCLN